MSSYNPLLLELQLAHKTTSMYSMKARLSSMGADLSGTGKWAGGVQTFNGSIFAIPIGATSILEIKSISDKIGLPRDILLSPYLNKI